MSALSRLNQPAFHLESKQAHQDLMPSRESHQIVGLCRQRLCGRLRVNGRSYTIWFLLRCSAWMTCRFHFWLVWLNLKSCLRTQWCPMLHLVESSCHRLHLRFSTFWTPFCFVSVFQSCLKRQTQLGLAPQSGHYSGKVRNSYLQGPQKTSWHRCWWFWLKVAWASQWWHTARLESCDCTQPSR